MSRKMISSTNKNDNIIETVRMVKLFWPDFQISPELIKKPTKDFALNFYQLCVTYLDETIESITKTVIEPNLKGLITEEEIFIKLSEINSLAVADFKLGDLFQFDRIRLYKHMHVIIHFLTFIQSIVKETTDLYDGVLNFVKQQEHDLLAYNELKEEMYRNKEQLSNRNQEFSKLEMEHTQLLPQYEEAVAAMEMSTKKLNNKNLEIAKIKAGIEKITDEIERLTTVYNNLNLEVVMEEEHLNLREQLNYLNQENTNLKEIDNSNDLIEYKQIIYHLGVAMTALNKLDLDPKIFDLCDCRAKIENVEERLKQEENLAHASQENAEKKLKELQLKKMKIEMENYKMQETLNEYNKAEELAESKLKEKEKLITQNEIEISESEKQLEEAKAAKSIIQLDTERNYNREIEIQNYLIDMYEKFMKEIAERRTL